RASSSRGVILSAAHNLRSSIHHPDAAAQSTPNLESCHSDPERSERGKNPCISPLGSHPFLLQVQRTEHTTLRHRQLNRPRRPHRRHRHLHPKLPPRLQRERTLRRVRNKVLHTLRKCCAIARSVG